MKNGLVSIIAGVVLLSCIGIGASEIDQEKYVLERYGDGIDAQMPDRIAFKIFLEMVGSEIGDVRVDDVGTSVYVIASALGYGPEYGGVEKLEPSEKERIAELRRQLSDSLSRYRIAQQSTTMRVYCEVPDTDISSEELLDRMKLIHLVPLNVAEDELTLFRNSLTDRELSEFETYFQERFKSYSGYTLIDNRAVYEPEMVGLDESQRQSYIRERFQQECFNLRNT